MSNYRAWVPNKTGLLSFSQIGNLSSTQIECAEAISQKKWIEYFCVERRTRKLDDSLFGYKYKLEGLLPGRKDTFFVLNSKCKSKGRSSRFLTGSITAYYGVHKPKVEKSIDLNSLKKLFSVNFCLSRTGECRLFNCNITDELLNHRENSNESFNLNQNSEGYLVSQAYMFLRDVTHRHKHHDPKSDTFLDIVPYSKNWKKRIAYRLGKKVIKQPLRNKPDTMQEALGILAYLRSFQSTFGVSVYTPDHLDSTKESLNAEYNKTVALLTNRRWVWGITLAGFYYWITKLINWEIGKWDIQNFLAAVGFSLLLLLALQQTNILDIRLKRWAIETFKILSFAKVRAAVLFVFIIAGSSLMIFEIAKKISELNL